MKIELYKHVKCVRVFTNMTAGVQLTVHRCVDELGKRGSPANSSCEEDFQTYWGIHRRFEKK